MTGFEHINIETSLTPDQITLDLTVESYALFHMRVSQITTCLFCSLKTLSDQQACRQERPRTHFCVFYTPFDKIKVDRVLKLIVLHYSFEAQGPPGPLRASTLRCPIPSSFLDNQKIIIPAELYMSILLAALHNLYMESKAHISPKSINGTICHQKRGNFQHCHV